MPNVIYRGEVSVTIVRGGKEVCTMYGAGKTMREAIIDALQCKLKSPDEEPQFGDTFLIENR